MKDATLTIRLPAATRRRIEEMARAKGHSLSQQVERLLWAGFAHVEGAVAEGQPQRWGPRPLADFLADGRVPTLADVREVRRALSDALSGQRHDRARERR
jgi:hypothetical protein